MEDVDFELELIQRDEINVTYILQLIAKLKGSDNDKEYEYQYKSIMDLLGGTPELRSKKDLIDKFIQTNLDNVQSVEQVPEAFENFWEAEKQNAINSMSEQENLDKEKLRILIDTSIYTNREPLRQDIIDTMKKKPKLLERENAFMRVNTVVTKFVDTFFGGI